MYHNNDVLISAATSHADSKHSIYAYLSAHRHPPCYKSIPCCFFDCCLPPTSNWVSYAAGKDMEDTCRRLLEMNENLKTASPHTCSVGGPCADGVLWGLGVFLCVLLMVVVVVTMTAMGTFWVGRLSWEVTYKNGYSCTGTAGPASSQGIPIRQIDCFLSSPPLIHVFHLSSNEPSAVWHRSGHLCIGPSLYCTSVMGNTHCPFNTHIGTVQSHLG